MKQEKYILLLNDNKYNLNKNKNYLSFLPLNPTIKYSAKVKEVNYDAPSKKEIYNRYEFCNFLFKKLIHELSDKLNHIHKVNFSTRAWDIVMGHWLRFYIYLSYKTYLQLKTVIKKYDIEKIYLTEFEDYDFTVSNTEAFTTITAINVDWYLCFCSKLYDYFKFGNKNIEKFSNKSQEVKTNDLNYIKNNKILIKALNLIGKFLKFNNDAFIYGTYLPFKEEKKLELYFKQFPTFYKEPKIIDEIKDFKTRDVIAYPSNDEEKNIENFIRENLKIFIPKFIIENFEKIKKISKSNNFPQNPKFIFTSSLYAFDETFKVYAASQVMKKKPYYVGQHGNNYFTCIHTNYVSEFNYSDKFLSWGYQKKERIKNLFNFKTLNKRISYKSNGKLIIVFDHLHNVSSNLYYTPDVISQDILSITSVIKRLDKSIRKDTILRLNRSFYKKIYGLKYFDLLKDIGITIDDGKKNMNKLIKEARLCLFTYDATGFLENYIYNIPSIIFSNKNYLNCINNESYPKYKELQKNEILFDEEENLTKHINSKWNDIYSWWNSERTKKTLDFFNKDLNNKPYMNCVKDLKKNLIIKK